MGMEKQAQPEPQNAFMEQLKTVSQLNLDKALVLVEGSSQVYERIVKLAARLLPGNIEKLEQLIANDLPNYAIAVHGVKGVLINIGACGLGEMAFKQENLARQGDVEACRDLHPVLIQALRDFSEQMLSICGEASRKKPPGEEKVLAQALLQIAGAIDFFDSVQALEILAQADNYSYGHEIDLQLADLRQALEGFDFEAAMSIVRRLEKT